MSYRLEIALVLLLAAAIGVAVWAANRSPKPPAFDLRASTFLAGPNGSQALHEVLLELGYRSERRRIPLLTLSEERAHRPAVLVVLDPVFDLDDGELAEVIQFVRGGGAVVAAGRGGGITRCAGWRLHPERVRDDSFAVRMPAGYANLRLPRVARLLVPRKLAPDSAGLEDLVKGDHEESIWASCATLVPLAADTVLATGAGRPIIMRLRYRGAGTITLTADGGWFTNATWRDTDVPVLLVPLLTPRVARHETRAAGRLAWDEYHQGFAASRASLAGRTWSWLRESPLGWAILQLIAVALVWLATTALRFGPARSVIERRRRSPLEHLEALGAGLEGASDSGTAVQRLILGLRRRLSRAGQTVDGNANLLPWLDSLELAVRGTDGRAALRRLRDLATPPDRTRAAGAGAGAGAGAHRVLQTAQAVEDVWEHLRPRTTRNAS